MGGLADLVNEFLAQGFSENTRRGYENDIRSFLDFRFRREHNHLPLEEAAQTYCNQICSTVSPATFNRTLAALRGFFYYAVERKTIAENPFKNVKMFKIAPHPQRISGAEFEPLIKSIDKSNFWGCRDYVIHILFYAFGLKPHELVALDVFTLRQDRSRESKEFLARSGLTDHVIFYLKGRPIPVEKRFAEEYNKYVTSLLTSGAAPSNPLIRNRFLERMCDRQVRRIVRNYAERYLFRQIAPRTLRNSYLANLKEKGVTPDSLCQAEKSADEQTHRTHLPESGSSSRRVPLLRYKYLPEYYRNLADKYKVHFSR